MLIFVAFVTSLLESFNLIRVSSISLTDLFRGTKRQTIRKHNTLNKLNLEIVYPRDRVGGAAECPEIHLPCLVWTEPCGPVGNRSEGEPTSHCSRLVAVPQLGVNALF